MGGCRPDRVVFDEFRGEFICAETGEVLEDRVVDYGPEWRSFSAGERSRSGLRPLRVRRRGVREVVEAVVSGVSADGLRADVKQATINRVYNVLTSVAQLPNLRFSGLDWVTGTVYASLMAMGYSEESVSAGLEGRGRLARLVEGLRHSLLNSRVQAIFREVRRVNALPDDVVVRSSRNALLITVPSVKGFNRVVSSVSGKLAGVNVFTHLPKSVRVSLPLAAKVFGVTQRLDGRVVVREGDTTLMIWPTSVNIYGPPLQPETLVRLHIPRVFWAATEF